MNARQRRKFRRAIALAPAGPAWVLAAGLPPAVYALAPDGRVKKVGPKREDPRDMWAEAVNPGSFNGTPWGMGGARVEQRGYRFYADRCDWYYVPGDRLVKVLVENPTPDVVFPWRRDWRGRPWERTLRKIVVGS